jgi:hypothetical protein
MNIQKLKYSNFKDCDLYLPDGILTINECVDEIDSELLDRIQNLDNINVNDDNSYYYFNNNALYNIDTSSLEYVIRSTSGSFTIDRDTLSVGIYSFKNCNQITELHLPNSLKNLPSGAFSSMSGLAQIDVNSPYFIDNDGILYSKNLSKLIAYPSANPNLRYDVISGVEIIDDYAFYGATGLNEVILPESSVAKPAPS